MIKLNDILLESFDWKSHTRGDIYYPPVNLGFTRGMMPQIDDQYQAMFFRYLRDNRIKFTKRSVHVRDLRPAQTELRVDVAHKLLKSNSTKLKKPIIVSSDNYLMDGHHRWFAFVLDDPNMKVNVIKVNLPGSKLLDMMNKFDYVGTKTIDNK